MLDFEKEIIAFLLDNTEFSSVLVGLFGLIDISVYV